jgi:hypothetical protein
MCHNRGMKKIYDKNLINKVKEEYKIDNYFSKKYEFIGIEYEEDETIINPLEKTQYIQFVLKIKSNTIEVPNFLYFFIFPCIKKYTVI